MNVDNDSCRKVIYMGDLQGAGKANDTCMKMMPVEMMDRSFTTLHLFRACDLPICAYYIEILLYVIPLILLRHLFLKACLCQFTMK
jgi:hypothetical protein